MVPETAGRRRRGERHQARALETAHLDSVQQPLYRFLHLPLVFAPVSLPREDTPVTCRLTPAQDPNRHVGHTGHGVSLRDASLIILFFALLTCIPPAFMG